MAQMKAVGCFESLPITNPQSLQDIKIEKPSPQEHDLLVEVKAISVNPIDTKVRKKRTQHQNQEPKILGWDVAGVVREVGETVTLFRPGDEVFYAGSISRPGGNSEFHLVDERITAKKPTNLSFEEAAALPLTAITAYEALFDRLGLPTNPSQNQNRTILIIGGAGGVGSIAIQLAKWAGLEVITTASRSSSTEWCRSLGADQVLDHSIPLMPQLESMGYAEIDLIFCLYQMDPYWKEIAKIIAPQGKICGIVDTTSPLNLNILKSKSVTFCWEFMFTRPLFQTKDLMKQHQLLSHISELVETRQLKTTLKEHLGSIHAENLRLAHQKIESGRTIGKIVLSGFSS